MKTLLASILAGISVTAICLQALPQFDGCLSQASTELEETYCDISAREQNADLPNLYQFRKNPENIQRLLLGRLAEKYDIALPETKKHIAQAQVAKLQSSENTLPSLSNCELKGNHISCPGEYYQLINNLKNNQLKAAAFSSHNQLIIPKKDDTEFREESDYRYLSNIYPIYIRKMLDLGLGDSTMSFTKFATVYWQSKLEETDFSERFRYMYNQLKIEKSRNQVRDRYRDNYPIELHQCMRLDDEIVVCDDMAQNWVYKRL